jgi:hypothetical protein
MDRAARQLFCHRWPSMAEAAPPQT